MSSISEQFSAAAKSQLEAQFNLLNAVASTAVGSAEKIIALTISTSRASLEKSSSAARQLLETKDPQQFFKLSKSEPPSLDQLLAYGRQLFSIASDAQAELMITAKEQLKGLSVLTPTVAAKPAPAAARPTLVKPVAATPAPVVVLAAVPAAATPAAEPAAPKAVAKPAPKVKPAAEAVAKLSPAPAAPFPVPATQAAAATDIKADIKKPALKSVASKAKPVAKAGTGPAIKAVAPKQLDTLGGKGKK